MSAKDKPASAQNLDERFDVVDERDEVIGQATRREVHARQLRHRAVHVLVFGADGRVFLQRRSLAKDSSPGLWDSSCSGHLDAGEGYDAAAHRELQEEIGLALPSLPEKWFYLESRPATGWEFVWIFRALSDGPFRLNPAEVVDGAWYFPEELTNALAATPEAFTAPFRLIWGIALERLRIAQ